MLGSMLEGMSGRMSEFLSENIGIYIRISEYMSNRRLKFILNKILIYILKNIKFSNKYNIL